MGPRERDFRIVRGQGGREVWERTGRAQETGVCVQPGLAEAEETGFREVALTQEQQESLTDAHAGTQSRLRWSEPPLHRFQSGPWRGSWFERRS